MVPVSFAVLILRHAGVLSRTSDLLNPVFRTLGLPGESAVVILSSVLLNLYSAVAVLGTLGLAGRETTILAVICLIAHNYPVELSIMKTTGSSLFRMLLLRSGAALLAGGLLNLVLPGRTGVTAGPGRVVPGELEGVVGGTGGVPESFAAGVPAWAYDTGFLLARVTVIVVLLMTIIRILQDTGFLEKIAEMLSPVMKVFGLPENTAFLWVVSQTLGLAYGAGVLRQEVREGRLARRDGDLLNHHLGISHSLFEDSLLFVAIGAWPFWIIAPRIVLATAAVHLRRMTMSRAARP